MLCPSATVAENRVKGSSCCLTCHGFVVFFQPNQNLLHLLVVVVVVGICAVLIFFGKPDRLPRAEGEPAAAKLLSCCRCRRWRRCQRRCRRLFATLLTLSLMRFIKLRRHSGNTFVCSCFLFLFFIFYFWWLLKYPRKWAKKWSRLARYVGKQVGEVMGFIYSSYVHKNILYRVYSQMYFHLLQYYPIYINYTNSCASVTVFQLPSCALLQGI